MRKVGEESQRSEKGVVWGIFIGGKVALPLGHWSLPCRTIEIIKTQTMCTAEQIRTQGLVNYLGERVLLGSLCSGKKRKEISNLGVRAQVECLCAQTEPKP